MFSLTLTAHQNTDYAAERTTSYCAVPSYIDPDTLYDSISSMSGTTDESSTPLESLIDHVGGKSQFDFLVLTFCESIQRDGNFYSVLEGIEIEQLSELITNLLNTGLSYSCNSIMVDDNIRSKIIKKNSSLVQVGLRSTQLKKLQHHFEAALCDSWVRGEVFKQCVERFSELLSIMEEENKHPSQAMDIDPKSSQRFTDLRAGLQTESMDLIAVSHANRAGQKVLSARSA